MSSGYNIISKILISLSKYAVAFMTLLLVQHCYKTIIFQHTVYLILTF